MLTTFYNKTTLLIEKHFITPISPSLDTATPFLYFKLPFVFFAPASHFVMPVIIMEDIIKLNRKTIKSGRAKALDILSIMAGVGIISIVCYSFIIQSALFAGATVFVAFAAAFLGGLMGFLFAIPKTNQSQLNCNNGNTCNTNGFRKEASIQYKFNTNLEQISDWLTKILIGVGLTQIHSLTKILYRTAGDFVANMGIDGHGSAFVVTITFIYFMTCGFMIGYLWTRLYYHGMLAIADRGVIDTINSRMEEVKKEVKQEMKEAVKQEVEDNVKSEIKPPNPG